MTSYSSVMAAVQPLTAEQRQLVESNLRIPPWVVRRWYGWLGQEIEEADEAAIDGLIRAAQKFDPSLGFKFSTYATRGCRQQVSRWLSNRRKRLNPLIPLFAQNEDGEDWIRDELCDMHERDPADVAAVADVVCCCRGAVSAHAWRALWERFAMGRAMRDIGNDTGITKQAVESTIRNAVRRIRIWFDRRALELRGRCPCRSGETFRRCCWPRLQVDGIRQEN